MESLDPSSALPSLAVGTGPAPPAIEDLEFPYCLYAWACGTEEEADFLHYGLWRNGTESGKQAQENLARLVRSLIPDGVERILDSGCGLGRTTADLTREGYSVVGISPDEKLMELARARFGRHLPFRTVRFEDYADTDAFDLVLFQESSNYIGLRTLLRHSRELLRPRGYLLLCDEVRYGVKGVLAFHRRDLLVKLAGCLGFRLLSQRDITREVMPTRAWVADALAGNREEIIRRFRPRREDVERELDQFLEDWDRHTAAFESGHFGYEVFLFQWSGTPLSRLRCALSLAPAALGAAGRRFRRG